MNKVICDVCGTAYPETAVQCPICGSAKQMVNNTVSKPSEKTHTKGGHFSNANVRKRMRANHSQTGKVKGENGNKQENPKSNRGLIIVAVILLAAITLALLFILFRYVGPLLGGGSGDTTTVPRSTENMPVQTTRSTEPGTTTLPVVDLSCTKLVLDTNEVFLDAVGREWLLSVSTQPENTTDKIQYSSSNPSVATVTDQGRITAVAGGEAVITVTCGNISKQCSVRCLIPEETTVPVTTEPITEPTTEPTKPTVSKPLVLDRDNVIITIQGGEYELSAGDISVDEIEWSTNDYDVAEIYNGVITAVGPGTTTVVASYNGQTAECTVICEFYKIDPFDDVTIAVGESFNLHIYDPEGYQRDVSWVSNDSDIASVDGNTVTGVASGDTTVYCTVDGMEMSCIIRVYES